MVKIVDSLRKIQKSVNAALAKAINAFMPRMARNIEPKIRKLVESELRRSPEIQELRAGGILAFEFGLDSDPTEEIVSSIVGSLEVKTKKLDRNLSGGVYVYMQPSSYANLFSLRASIQETEKGVQLPWLEWLLLRGDEIIVAGFGVKIQSGAGRSGGATMKEGLTPYKVNSSYSGTLENNFITRAIERVSPQIEKIIEGGFK